MQTRTFETLTLLLALPPAMVAIIQLFGKDDQKGKGSAGTIALSLLTIVSAVALALAYRYAPPPPIVETKATEKPVPCPAIKTGSVTQRGSNGIAHSGNNDTFTLSEPHKDQKK